MALERGQVIALRRNGAAMVWSSTKTHVWVVPIGGYNGPPPHRAEVRFNDPREIFSCGVSFRFPVVRCHMGFGIAMAAANASTVIGLVPASLLSRINQAIMREAETRALEARVHHNGQRNTQVMLVA